MNYIQSFYLMVASNEANYRSYFDILYIQKKRNWNRKYCCLLL